MPAPRLHPFWRLFLCAGSLVAASLLVVSVMSAAVAWSATLTHRVAAHEIVDFWADPVNELWAQLLFYPLALICLITCRHTLDRRSVSSLGLRPTVPAAAPSGPRAFGSGALCGALAISFLFGMLWSAGGVRIVGFSPEAFGGGVFVSITMLLLYGALFFSVGFMEELVFRGYALHNLRAWLGIAGAVGTQALLFALAHAGNGGQISWQAFFNERWAMVNLVLIGLFFAIAYLKTGTLWFPIGFHVAWNFCLGCVWSLPVSGIPVFRLLDVTSSGNTTLSGGSFGAEGSILLAPLILAMLWLLHGLPDHPHALADLATLSPPFADEPEVAAAPDSDWAEPDPNRERRFKTSMRAESEPEVTAAELQQLARELDESSRRAALAAQPPAPVLPAAVQESAAIEIPAPPPAETPPVVPAPVFGGPIAVREVPAVAPVPIAMEEPEGVVEAGDVVGRGDEPARSGVRDEQPVKPAAKPRW